VDRPLRSLPERATAVALVEASDPRAIVAEPPVTITEEPVAATDPNAEASPLPS
jgi:hypothetical protein